MVQEGFAGRMDLGFLKGNGLFRSGKLDTTYDLFTEYLDPGPCIWRAEPRADQFLVTLCAGDLAARGCRFGLVAHAGRLELPPPRPRLVHFGRHAGGAQLGGLLGGMGGRFGIFRGGLLGVVVPGCWLSGLVGGLGAMAARQGFPRGTRALCMAVEFVGLLAGLAGFDGGQQRLGVVALVPV
jgi:hypothetical protein